MHADPVDCRCYDCSPGPAYWEIICYVCGGIVLPLAICSVACAITSYIKKCRNTRNCSKLVCHCHCCVCCKYKMLQYPTQESSSANIHSDAQSTTCPSSQEFDDTASQPQQSEATISVSLIPPQSYDSSETNHSYDSFDSCTSDDDDNSTNVSNPKQLLLCKGNHNENFPQPLSQNQAENLEDSGFSQATTRECYIYVSPQSKYQRCDSTEDDLWIRSDYRTGGERATDRGELVTSDDDACTDVPVMQDSSTMFFMVRCDPQIIKQQTVSLQYREVECTCSLPVCNPTTKKCPDLQKSIAQHQTLCNCVGITETAGNHKLQHDHFTSPEHTDNCQCLDQNLTHQFLDLHRRSPDSSNVTEIGEAHEDEKSNCETSLGLIWDRCSGNRVLTSSDNVPANLSNGSHSGFKKHPNQTHKISSKGAGKTSLQGEVLKELDEGINCQ